MNTKINPLFPIWNKQKPIVESYFIKLHPSPTRTLWIRYTITNTHSTTSSNNLSHGALWFLDFNGFLVDAHKQTYPVDQVLAAPTHLYLKIGPNELRQGRISGALNDLSWDLTFEIPCSEFMHFPFSKFYNFQSFPEVKLVTPCYTTHFYGLIRSKKDELHLDGVPGMLGHNWSWNHFPYQWVWIHSNVFEHPDISIEVAAARPHPLLPFVVVGFIHTPDGPLFFNSPLSIARNRLKLKKTGVSFTLHSCKGQLHGDISFTGSSADLCYVDPLLHTGQCRFRPHAFANIELQLGARSYSLKSPQTTLEVMTKGLCKNTLLDDREVDHVS